MKGGVTVSAVTPMSATYYAFLLNLWIMRRLTESQVLAYVPKYITQEEADMILATPQI
jgi:hypothetical protein